MRGAILTLVTALTLGAAVPAAEPRSAPLSVREIVALLQAGIGEKVILKRVEAARIRPVITVEALLELKAAGASDELLEALVSPADGPEPGTTGSRHAPPGYRIYTEPDEWGEPVLHITNLDSAGRRIGGEVEPRAADRSQASSRGVSSVAAPEAGPSQAPVIVNIYPQAGSGELPPGDVHDAGSLYPRGRYPGFAFFPRQVRSHAPRGTQEQFFGRPRIIDTSPYRAATPAARNRARFKRD